MTPLTTVLLGQLGTVEGNALTPEQEERIRKRLNAAKHKIAERINTAGQITPFFVQR